MNLSLKGNYQNHPIKLQINQSKTKSNKIFINIHGLYGLSGDRGSKSLQLGNLLFEKYNFNVVYFSSSRNWKIYDDSDPLKKMAAFKDKTFQQEQKDLKDTLNYILTEFPDGQLYLVGNSLGGTLACSLISQFPQIQKIVLCGSGIGPSSSTKPILSTYPPKSDIENPVSQFTGSVLLLQGSLDEIVPLSSQDELLNDFKNAQRQKIVIDGANHNFSSINGSDKERANFGLNGNFGMFFQPVFG